MSQEATRGAVLQFEISREWWNKLHLTQLVSSQENALQRLYSMASSAACDVIRNGGTFVLVVSEKKITMVQRPDAEEIG